MKEPSSATADIAQPISDRPGWAEVSRRGRRIRSSAIRDLLAVTANPELISLAGGLPDRSAMPEEWLSECVQAALTETGALQYSTTEGDLRLRASIAGWESGWTGRPVGELQVLVTAGAQQALDLLGKALLDPGDVVVVEDPAYVGAIQAFELSSARLVAIPQDDDGMDTDRLAGLLAAGLRPRFVYTTATFHNPAGTTMPEPRRRQLAELAERYGFLIVEDDAYRRLYFDAPPPRPIAYHCDRVVRLGTFSKILSPGMRVGWIAAPAELVSALARVKQATDLHTSTLAQAALARAVADEPRLAAHVAEIRALYKSRAARLVAVLQREFGANIDAWVPSGGMFTWLRFQDGTHTDALLPEALQAGVAFVPGSAFSIDDGNRHALRLCFATVEEDRLVDGVERLAAAHRRLHRGG